MPCKEGNQKSRRYTIDKSCIDCGKVFHAGCRATRCPNCQAEAYRIAHNRRQKVYADRQRGYQN